MVFNSLSSEGFFLSGENSRVVKNKNTKSEIEINKSGIQVTVDFDIKKSPQKNKFWVYRINVKENAEVNSFGADALKRRPNLDIDNSISKDNGNVNRYSKELFPEDRTMNARKSRGTG